MRFTISTAAFALVAFASSVFAHMEMTDPAPFRSKHNTLIDQSTYDFDMNAPLHADGSNFPCKNYHLEFDEKPAGNSTATWAAGTPQKVTLDDKAAHDGGSCQLSLSFDGGKTFRVIKSIEGGCVNPQGGEHTFDFNVPADTKSGKAIFAWTWFNHTGNREMYMNCAAVTITGTGTSTLNDRPEIFKANIGNGCKTEEGTDVQFPNPGPDVEVISQKNLRIPCGDTDSPQPDQSVNPSEPADSSYPDSTSSADSLSSADSTSLAVSTSSADSADASYSATPTDSDVLTKEPVPTRTSNASTPATTPTPTGTISPTKYTVKAGDICIDIAKKQDVTLANLFKLNPDINKDCKNLKVGQVLNIRRRSRIMRDLD